MYFKKFLHNRNEAYLKPVFDTIMKQLKRKHAEVRLSAFQMLKELFIVLQWQDMEK